MKCMIFKASWCSPCKVLKPIYDKVKQNTTGVDFEEIDIDDSPELAQQFNVRAVPTILFVKDGQVVDTLVGVQKEQALLDMINKWK